MSRNIYTSYLLGMSLMVAGMVYAQSSPTPSITKPEIADFAPILDWSDGLRTFRLVESWVTASGSNPTVKLEKFELEKEDGAESIRVSGASGVCVTIRRGGWSIGMGQAWLSELTHGQPTSPMGRGDTKNNRKDQPVVDLARLARIATVRALKQARETFRAAQEHAAQPTGATTTSASDAPDPPDLPDTPKISESPVGLDVSGTSVITDTVVTPGPSVQRQDRLVVEPIKWRDLTPLLEVDVQIARDLQPIRFHHELGGLGGAGGNHVAMIRSQLSPGFHGLRLSRKTMNEAPPDEAWSWPGNALAANLSTNSQVIQLLDQLGFPPTRLQAALANPDLLCERFEVIHLVRPSSGQAVTQLVRGNHLIPPVSLSGPSIDALAQGLASHLMGRILSDGRLAGTFLPSADRYDPTVAPAQEAALAAYALGRHASYLSRLSTTPQSARDDVQEAVERITHGLLTALAVPADHLDLHPVPAVEPEATGSLLQVRTATEALVLLTLLESPGFVDRKPMRDQLGRHLLSLINEDGSLQAGHDEDARSYLPSVEAMVVVALASLYRQTHDESLGLVVRRMISSLANERSTEDSLDLLPWLAMAHDRLARLDDAPRALLESSSQGDKTKHNTKDLPAGRVEGASGSGGDHDNRTRIHFEQLNQLAAFLRGHQIKTRPSVGPSDVVGGFDVASMTSASNRYLPTPDWRSAGYLTCLSLATQLLALNSSETRDAAALNECVDLLLDCGLAVRFLAQLTFDEASSYYVRSGDDVIGGIRQNLSDNRLTVAATATALLAVTDLLETLVTFAPQRAGP